MEETNPFLELIERARRGDQRAAEELVQTYEAQVRRVIRTQMRDPSLRRLVDSVDICQSVLATFFVRIAAGQFDVESPQDLIALLATIARNKVAKLHRRQTAKKKGHREVPLQGEVADNIQGGLSPLRMAEGRDLLKTLRKSLPEMERRLADMRSKGLSWNEIAEKEGGNADMLRMRFKRALDSAVEDLEELFENHRDVRGKS